MYCKLWYSTIVFYILIPAISSRKFGYVQYTILRYLGAGVLRYYHTGTYNYVVRSSVVL
jgi:hypothetical protein